MTAINQNMSIEDLRFERKLLSEIYIELSKLEELFGKNSKHKAAIALDKKMRDILKQLKEIDNKLAD